MQAVDSHIKNPGATPATGTAYSTSTPGVHVQRYRAAPRIPQKSYNEDAATAQAITIEVHKSNDSCISQAQPLNHVMNASIQPPSFEPLKISAPFA